MMRLAFSIAISLSTLAHATTAFANETASISAELQKYWTAFAASDYEAVANTICDEDLVGLRTGLLPLFERLSTFKEPEPRQMYNAFFDGVSESEHAGLNDRQVFVQLQKFLSVATPQLTTYMRQSTITPVETAIDSDDKSLATVKYKVTFRGLSQTDFQQFRRTGDGWCLIPPETVGNTVEKFRRLFRM